MHLHAHAPELLAEDVSSHTEAYFCGGRGRALPRDSDRHPTTTTPLHATCHRQGQTGQAEWSEDREKQQEEEQTGGSEEGALRDQDGAENTRSLHHLPPAADVTARRHWSGAPWGPTPFLGSPVPPDPAVAASDPGPPTLALCRSLWPDMHHAPRANSFSTTARISNKGEAPRRRSRPEQTALMAQNHEINPTLTLGKIKLNFIYPGGLIKDKSPDTG